MTLQINKKVSYYNNRIITDTKIMDHIGVYTYSKLLYKYPYLFQHFKECSENIVPCEGHIPSEISLYISSDPYKIKRDIILLICGKNIGDEYDCHRLLINSSEKPNHPLLEKEDNTFLWIFICIVMIFLIFLAFFVIYHLDINGKF